MFSIQLDLTPQEARRELVTDLRNGCLEAFHRANVQLWVRAIPGVYKIADQSRINDYILYQVDDTIINSLTASRLIAIFNADLAENLRKRK